MEVSSTGVMRAFVYSGGKLVAMQGTDGQFYWLHTNHLGNARTMTDASGNVAYGGQFDPYGQTLAEWSATGNTTLNTKKFTGYERDAATGLDYAQARMYNSSRGRFTSPDPIGLNGAKLFRPQTLNRYSYTYNDPVNHIDPTGLDPEGLECGWIYEYDPETGRLSNAQLVCGPSGDRDGNPDEEAPDEADPVPVGLPTYKELLIEYLRQLSPKCLEAVGGQAKVDGWIAQLQRDEVRFYHRSSPAKIPDHPKYSTVYDYWNAVNEFGHGATVVSGARFNEKGELDPNGHYNDARKFNMIIIGDPRSTTLIHEFLHWETSGFHFAIVGKLGLGARGYDVSTDPKAREAIHDFFESGCEDGPLKK